MSARTITGSSLAECEAQLAADERIVHTTGSRVTGDVRCVVESLTPAQKAARTRRERNAARATAERELATPEGRAKNERLIAELTR